MDLVLSLKNEYLQRKMFRVYLTISYQRKILQNNEEILHSKNQILVQAIFTT